MVLDYLKYKERKGLRKCIFLRVIGDPVCAESKIRVLRIISRMNLGGPAIQITGLMQNLPKARFEQLLVAGQCGPEEIDFLTHKDIDFQYLKVQNLYRNIHFFSDLMTLFKIRQLIKEFEPNIVHTHTAKAGFLGRLAALLTLKKCILIHTFHGHLLHGYFGPTKTKILISIERLLARFTDTLISVGEKVRDDLLSKKIGNLSKYIVIGPGLQLETLPNPSSSRERFNIPGNTFVVTWIGRLVPVKAPERILEIAQECVKRNLNVHFVIAGDGPMLKKLNETALASSLPITFLGWQRNIEPILCFSNIVMLTSENEGTPVALIQAQMAGVPVLTTNVGSASEVMINYQSGFCLAYTPLHFVDKIEFFINNPITLNTFGKIGYENSHAKFSLQRLVNDHAKLYEKIIHQSKF